MSKGTKALGDLLKLISTRTTGYDNWFPRKVRVVSGGDGRCVCEVTVDKEMVNMNDNLHGGCMAFIVDMIASAALMTSSKPNPGVSVDISVSYLSAAKLGEDIVVDAKTLKAGRTLAFMSVDIARKRDGALIATGKNTKYIGQS